MNTDRRNFLKSAGLTLSALTLAQTSGWTAAQQRGPNFVTRPPTMKLGLVTYNIAQDWDVDTIIKNCEQAKFQGVELRTTHAHKVEVNLSKSERDTVKKKFQNSRVELMGLGSIFDYHTPDQAKLKKDIEATKEYIILAQDVGASGIKVRPNALPKEVAKEKTLEQIGRSLLELGKFGADHGVVIRLEVHGTPTSLLPNIKTILDVANHKNVGACWNSNASDLEGEGFEANFNMVKDRINAIHMRDLYLEDYPFRKLLTSLNGIGYNGYCLAEIGASADPVRVMRYYRALWLAYQNLL